MNAWSVSNTSSTCTPSVLALVRSRSTRICGAYGRNAGEQVLELGGALGLFDEALRHGGELLDRPAAAVLELELEAADAREPAERRRD